MKGNEIGHHPFVPPRHQFDNGGYYPEVLDDEAEAVKFKPNFKILGEASVITLPEGGVPYGKCLFDLQAGSYTCYTAMELIVDGVTYVALIGNGWGEECGSPKDDVETNVGVCPPVRPSLGEAIYRHERRQRYPLQIRSWLCKRPASRDCDVAARRG